MQKEALNPMQVPSCACNIFIINNLEISPKRSSVNIGFVVRANLAEALPACSPKRIYENKTLWVPQPESSFSIGKIHELICPPYDVIRDLLPEMPEYKKERIKCNCCGNLLRFIVFLEPLPGWWPSG